MPSRLIRRELGEGEGWVESLDTPGAAFEVGRQRLGQKERRETSLDGWDSDVVQPLRDIVVIEPVRYYSLAGIAG